jgi:hypothetical protein
MWFCACVFKVAERDGRRDADSLWEEVFLLIEAENENSARSKAERLARHDAAPYKNESGNLVSWKFEKVDRISPISDGQLRNGTELFSRFLRDSEVRSLMTPFAG